MKAVVLTRAGSPDRLQVSDVPTPHPGPGDVLVGVHATTVTRGDVVSRRMPRLAMRLFGETPKSILGHEFAGIVVAVGADVEGYVVGDRVFGTTGGLAQGSHAEFIAVPADGILAKTPDGICSDQAAPVPVGAMTALHFLNAAEVAEGSRVLINGASGSVGTFAVQIAKEMGARVTGVARTEKLEMVSTLGADSVVDYTTCDVTSGDQRYDVVFDTAGKLSKSQVAALLSDGGKFASTRTRRDETIEELITVRDLLAKGAIKAVIDERFPLDRVADAHHHVERGHKRGNVLVILDLKGGDHVPCI